MLCLWKDPVGELGWLRPFFHTGGGIRTAGQFFRLNPIRTSIISYEAADVDGRVSA